jgi:hypothetical protein
MLWCALGYGITLGWVVLQLTANATFFPPLYNFSALAVGNINISVSTAPRSSSDHASNPLLTTHF